VSTDDDRLIDCIL